MQRAEDLGHAVGLHPGEHVVRRRVLEFVEVVGVPQADLRNRRVESHLVHPTVGVTWVRLPGVPEPMVEHDHRAGRPGELLLAGDVLVAVEAR